MLSQGRARSRGRLCWRWTFHLFDKENVGSGVQLKPAHAVAAVAARPVAADWKLAARAVAPAVVRQRCGRQAMDHMLKALESRSMCSSTMAELLSKNAAVRGVRGIAWVGSWLRGPCLRGRLR